ncbi:hypothetical protein [Mycobacterium sp. NPDC050853]|uniref:hypothetical protein n=1 Tax=Mycobacteriaceae TaxID=1762 RepID=UPI0015DF655D|nr:hypothetical protein [Mycobacteroides sp. LB1]
MATSHGHVAGDRSPEQISDSLDTDTGLEPSDRSRVPERGNADPVMPAFSAAI